MKLSRLVAGIGLPLLMAGCSSLPGTTYYLEELQHTTPTGTPFTEALAHEYLAFAEADRKQYAWFDSWHFAKKGLDAAHGAVVAPEQPSEWDVGATARDEAEQARARLEKVLASSAPNRVPALTATAQVKFDCWVEKLSKPWQTDAIEGCRKDFMAALDAIEAQGHPVAAAPAATRPSAPAAAPAPGAERFQVTFALNSDHVGAEAGPTIAAIARAAQDAGYPHLAIIGFTDSTGNAAYNQRLSLRRAEAVRKALIAAGVPADRLAAEGHGIEAGGPDSRRVVVRFPK